MLSQRRQFILGAGAIVVGSTGALFIGSKPKANVSPDTKTLISIIDTIIPQDQFAGAIDIGLDIKIQQQIDKRLKLKELLTRIITNITAVCAQQHQSHFFELNVDQRENLLNSIINNFTKPLIRRDLVLLRNTVFTFYYQSETGTASLGYMLPTNYPVYSK